MNNKLKQYKNIFLDRDGIINEVIIRNGLVSSPRNFDEFVIRNDFLNFIKLTNNNFNFFVMTNQPDIKRNLLSEADLKKMHFKLNSILNIKKIYVCRHDDSDMCMCRKPKPGMLLKALDEFNLKKSESLMIGDSFKDMQAAESANIHGILLDTVYNKQVKYKHKFTNLVDLLSS